MRTVLVFLVTSLSGVPVFRTNDPAWANSTGKTALWQLAHSIACERLPFPAKRLGVDTEVLSRKLCGSKNRVPDRSDSYLGSA